MKEKTISKTPGILVTDGLIDTLAYDFIRCACLISDRPAISSAVWRKPPSWTHNRESLPLLIGECSIINKSNKLNLLTFPPAIIRDFTLDCLDFPFNLVGLVLIIDLSDESYWARGAKFFDGIRSTKSGGVGWTRESMIPGVIITVNNGADVVSKRKMFDLLGLNPNTPVFSYYVQTNVENSKGRGHFSFIFTHEFTQNVLSSFIFSSR